MKKLFIFIAFIIFIISGCVETNMFKIGFVGTFTNPTTDFGVAVRNGLILAVEKANKEGGINGKRIKLIIKDDKGDPELARQIERQIDIMKTREAQQNTYSHVMAVK